MFIKLKPFSYSLIFLLGMELFFLFNSWALYILPFLLLTAIITGKLIGKKWMFSISLSLLAIFSGGLTYLITFPRQRQIFIWLAFIMYYLIVLGIFRIKSCPQDKTAKGMIVAGSFSTLFFALASFYGFYLNFLIPIFVLILVYFSISFLISLQTLSLFEKNNRRVIFYSLVISFAIAQIAWALNFWPFGYLTTGIIALILYYILWEIVKSYFLLLLSKKRIVWQVISFSLLAMLVLFTSKWTPNF